MDGPAAGPRWILPLLGLDLETKGLLIPFSRLFLRVGGTQTRGKRSAPLVGFGAADGPSCARVLGDIWLHFPDGQWVAHCSVWGSDVKLSALCSRTPATLRYSDSEICAAT